MSERKVTDINFERIKEGDLKAYEILFKSQYPAISRYAFKIVRDSTVAEEIAQDIFLYIWEKREQIHITGSLTSYLYSAAKNKCINWLKLELPRIQSTQDVSDTDIMEQASEVNLERNEEIKRIINQSIEVLPRKCKEIFILSRYGGLTYEEIAEDLDLSKKTVENQMGIALKKLRETLKPLLRRLNE